MVRLLISLVIICGITGCRDNFYTEVDFPSVHKTDVHMHISTTHGFFEKQARNDNFILLTINVDVADSAVVEKQSRAAKASSEKYRGRVFYAATFHFDTTAWGTPLWSKRTIDELDRYIGDNAVSVKLWKNIGMTERDRSGRFIMADNEGLDPLIEHIISKKLPVTAHLGEPKNCWLPLDKMTIKGDSSYFAENPQYHMYKHPEYPSYEDQINARDSLLKKHPDLIMIGCHLGSLEYSVDELADRLDKFPNLAVDMAARICHLQYQAMHDYKKIRDFIIKYQDRLLYGTDLSDSDSNDSTVLKKHIHDTWFEDWKFFVTEKTMHTWNFRGSFRGLHLPKDVVDKIFYKNAVRWYRLKVL